MNAALESLINQIYTDEFNDTEIILISDETFHLEDLVALEKAIETNEWVKANLKVLMLEPNDIVPGALGIDGSRGFYVRFKHSINFCSISTKEQLEAVLQQLRTNTFHYSAIGFGDDRVSTDIVDLTDSELQELVTAINESEWCQKYLKALNLDHAHISHLPAIRCKNLREMRIYSNPIDETEEISCPALKHVVAHFVSKFDIKAFLPCENLQQIDAFGSNMRVPPNVMDFTHLRQLNVLDGSPLSPLGIYALLLMKLKKRFDISDHGSDLTQKFATLFTQHPEFRIRENFHDNPLSYWGIKPLVNVDAEKFIDEFIIPEHFYEQQVEAMVSFMKKIYHTLVPIEVSDDGRIIIVSNVQPRKFKRGAKLETLNAQYRSARSALFSRIDGLIERKYQFGEAEVVDILDEAIEKSSEILAEFEQHNEFLLAELYSDFNTLMDIFSSAGKQQHAYAVCDYVEANKESWNDKLDVRKMLIATAQEYLDERFKKRSSSENSAETETTQENTRKKQRDDEESSEAESTAPKWRCIIS